jgi:hypothetical protein
MEVSEYVIHLERQVAALKEMVLKAHGVQQYRNQPHEQQQMLPFSKDGVRGLVGAAAGSGISELLDFLKNLPSNQLAGLTSNMCIEVLDAMDCFVARLMGTANKEQLSSMTSEFRADELSKVLFWLLCVGYALRTAEMRLEALALHGEEQPNGSNNLNISNLFPISKSNNRKWFGDWGKLLPGGM